MTSSRPEAAQRLLAAASALGAREGIGALSIQGIADAADVSKALVLYHFDGKAALFAALHRDLCERAAERLRAAARTSDALEAWRRVVHTEVSLGELPLLAALRSDASIRDTDTGRATRDREGAATELAVRILESLDLEPRIEPALLGRTLLRHLDGVAAAFAPRASRGADEALGDPLDAELDAFALAFLALGE